MKSRVFAATAFLSLVFLLGGCATGHNGMNATLWVQTSAEYRGNSALVYNVAEAQLPVLRENPGVTADLDQAAALGCQVGVFCEQLTEAGLPPAVILDIDETVLDNSYYQARLVKSGGHWQPDTWDDWVAERAAIAVPGAIDFIRRAKAEGISVVYVTNRRCMSREGFEDPCPQKQDTLANLASAGFPALDQNDHLILRAERTDWDASEKQSRRAYIAERYRILMLVGDDLGDFASGIKSASVDERAAFIESYQHLLGEFWFQLTNPTYGSWMRALGDKSPQEYLRLN